MNLHEYQAKELLKRYNVPVQEGVAVGNPAEAVNAYKGIASESGSKFVVVKAQIHAGGRGKGTIKEAPEQHGVQVVKSVEDVEKVAKNILGNTLVTIQTGPHGKTVHKLAGSAGYVLRRPQRAPGILHVHPAGPYQKDRT